jgi:hypothetical protein
MAYDAVPANVTLFIGVPAYRLGRRRVTNQDVTNQDVTNQDQRPRQLPSRRRPPMELLEKFSSGPVSYPMRHASPTRTA